MSQNPLFPPNNHPANQPDGADQAADLIRHKLDLLYKEEPNAKLEEKEVAVAKPKSKHQQFMYDLSTSGKSLAEIQTAWHQYYANLPDHEKHEVWQEFYEAQRQVQKHPFVAPQPRPTIPQASANGVVAAHLEPAPLNDARPTDKIKDTIKRHARRVNKSHLHSLLFGLGSATIVLLIFLFSFFNEFVIAPFIQPGREVSNTPIIVDPASATVSAEDKIIIPKINVEIPVDYSLATTNNSDVENALDSGVVHYPTTVKPGELGNAAFFGHSSNNIFNKGKYKFAFLLLSKLQNDDVFYLTYNGTLYAYKVIDKKIVNPSEVGVLGPVEGQPATVSLITCDPPGTTLHRLVVIGQQITPDPAANKTPDKAGTTYQTADQLPGNGPTLWSRFWNWATGQD